MQKATVWNMPVSSIVAKDWNSFVELPNQVKCLFYWWEPDPTFLLLNPTEMIFPAHVEKEWKQGIQTSAGQQAVRNGVSRTLCLCELIYLGSTGCVNPVAVVSVAVVVAIFFCDVVVFAIVVVIWFGLLVSLTLVHCVVVDV